MCRRGYFFSICLHRVSVTTRYMCACSHARMYTRAHHIPICIRRRIPKLLCDWGILQQDASGLDRHTYYAITQHDASIDWSNPTTSPYQRAYFSWVLDQTLQLLILRYAFTCVCIRLCMVLLMHTSPYLYLCMCGERTHLHAHIHTHIHTGCR